MLQSECLFSSDGLRPGDRLSCWNDVILARIGPISVTIPDPPRFSASLERFRLEELEILSPLCSPSVSVNRSSEAGSDVLNLTLQHLGRSWNHTNGRTSMLESGDFTLYDPAQRLELRTLELTQMIVVKMSAAQAESHVPGLRAMVGAPICGSRGGGAIVSGFLRAAWSQLRAGAVDGWPAAFADAFWSVLPLAYAPVSVVAKEQDMRDRRWQEVRSIVARNLGDAGFGVQEIAQELGVSARYVQIIFAQHGTTSSAYIQKRRVQTAAERLARGARSFSITDIGFDVGFGDASSFCRAFRKFYGMSPRDYRAGRLGQSPRVSLQRRSNDYRP